MNERKAWQETLPKKRMGAGALFLDEQNRVLLVNPTYKPQWEIPGGIVEQDESPRAACIREVKEELGLVRSLERLLCVNYLTGTDQRTEALMFIFWGGVLTANEIAMIRLPTAELSEYRFVTVDEALRLLTPTLGDRVRRSLAILPTNSTLYLET
ncbi:MAG: NUDIX hydrolase [Chloroflexi bacterium]|nr:NUDIX hydrolase [Chloroflexota bacterium]